MKPLEIKMYLDTPIIAPDFIRFDALLAWFWFKEHGEDQISFDLDKLPMRKVYCAGEWFYDCSVSVIQEKHAQFTTIKKQINTTGMTKNINIAHGQYCSDLLTQREIQADFVTFYAYGDKAEIERLLANCHAIGKHRKNGKGTIREINVTQTKAKQCIRDDATGALLRFVPFKFKTFQLNMLDCKWILRNSRIRPPYNSQYGTVDVMPCLAPGSILSNESFAGLKLTYKE